VEDQKAAQRALHQPSGEQPKTEDGFLVPPLPSRIGPSTTGEVKKAGQGKATFPDIHLDFLLSKITEMQATSIISLTEAIYLDLKEHKVKKNAIEAKVKEVAEKCKEKKCWVVKPSYRVCYFHRFLDYHGSDSDDRLILWKSHNPASMRVDMDVVLAFWPPIPLPASTAYHDILSCLIPIYFANVRG